MNKIIIDTDPGVDDSMAIQFALASPELEIIGLTSIFGNVNVDLATINALRLLDIADKQNIPVAKGASKPLHGEFNGGVPFVHGKDGQGNTFKPLSSQTAISLTAQDFIIEQLEKFPDEITIVALGPLTNLAKVVKKRPGIDKIIKSIVIMGGNAFCPGNATPSAEANMFGDPHAADIIFELNCPITMVGLDVTHKIILTNELIKEISKFDSPLNKHVSDSYTFYRDFFVRVNNIEGTFVHDSLVIAYLIAPHLFTVSRYPIRVEVADCISKGKTWPSMGNSDHEDSYILNPWKNRPEINICLDVDSASVLNLLKSRLMS